MRKTRRPGAAWIRTTERVVGLLCVLAAGVLLATHQSATRAFAQERAPASKPLAASGDATGGARSTVLDDGNLDAGDDGSNRSSRPGSSESLLSAITNAP